MNDNYYYQSKESNMTFNERILVLMREISLLELYGNDNYVRLDDIERKLWYSHLNFKRLELQALEQIQYEQKLQQESITS